MLGRFGQIRAIKEICIPKHKLNSKKAFYSSVANNGLESGNLEIDENEDKNVGHIGLEGQLNSLNIGLTGWEDFLTSVLLDEPEAFQRRLIQWKPTVLDSKSKSKIKDVLKTHDPSGEFDYLLQENSEAGIYNERLLKLVNYVRALRHARESSPKYILGWSRVANHLLYNKQPSESELIGILQCYGATATFTNNPDYIHDALKLIRTSFISGFSERLDRAFVVVLDAVSQIELNEGARFELAWKVRTLMREMGVRFTDPDQVLSFFFCLLPCNFPRKSAFDLESSDIARVASLPKMLDYIELIEAEMNKDGMIYSDNTFFYCLLLLSFKNGYYKPFITRFNHRLTISDTAQSNLQFYHLLFLNAIQNAETCRKCLALFIPKLQRSLSLNQSIPEPFMLQLARCAKASEDPHAYQTVLKFILARPNQVNIDIVCLLVNGVQYKKLIPLFEQLLQALKDSDANKRRLSLITAIYEAKCDTSIESLSHLKVVEDPKLVEFNNLVTSYRLNSKCLEKMEAIEDKDIQHILGLIK